MRNILCSEQDENCLNNLWCSLIWRMNSVHFSITSMTCYMNFLIYSSQCISMIFWSTWISCLSIEDTYDWYSNDCEKQIYNVTFENINFMQIKWHILTWLWSEKKSKWIQQKLKQSWAEKTHKMCMTYNHFLNLQIFINDLSRASQKLYNHSWIWLRKQWSLHKIWFMNTYLMIWRSDSWLS